MMRLAHCLRRSAFRSL